jgi:hypothetical protein
MLDPITKTERKEREGKRKRSPAMRKQTKKINHVLCSSALDYPNEQNIEPETDPGYCIIDSRPEVDGHIGICS